MQFAAAVLSGVVVGVVVLLTTQAKASADGSTQTFSPIPGWTAVVLGAIAATLLIISFVQWIEIPGVIALLVGGAFASAIIGIGGLIRKDRRWQNWVGAVVGGVPALFWLFFAAAEVLFPHS